MIKDRCERLTWEIEKIDRRDYVEGSLQGQPYPNIDVIVGRDVLDRYEFHYDGPQQKFRIIY